MLIPPTMRTEHDWTYEPLRHAVMVPVLDGYSQQRQGRRRRPAYSYTCEDSVELSLDSQVLGLEEELARVWDLFSPN